MAAAGAAATSPARVRRNAQQAQRLETKRQLSARRQRLRERTGEKFDVLSDDGEWLSESQVEELFSSAMFVDQDKLHPDAVRLVVDTARRSQERAGRTPPHEGALVKDHLVLSVTKYGEYIRKVKKIDAVFHIYDKGKDGYLSRQELRRMLQDYERNVNRQKWRKLVVLEEDIDWILEQSDADNSGMIDHAEFLPAVAAWEELAQMKLEQSNTSCTIQ